MKKRRKIVIKVKLIGEGKKSDPYIISNIEDLMCLSRNPILWDECLYFHLLSDIDLKECEFTSIGWESVPFRGIFEGNGCKIKNLTINLPQIQGVGLFGHSGVGANVGSVILLDANIVGKDGCGAIVGCNEGGIIRSCKVEGGTIKTIAEAGKAAIGICIGANYNGGLVCDCTGKTTLITADEKNETDKKENIIGCNHNITVF
jgi:hypothetical protein